MGCCFGQDAKADSVHRYILRYVFLLKSVAVYALDIFTAVTMVSSNHVCFSIDASIIADVYTCTVDKCYHLQMRQRLCGGCSVQDCQMGICRVHHLFLPPACIRNIQGQKGHRF